MGEVGTMKETRQRIGVSTGDFYREKAKVRRKLKKLKPIWVRFGKGLQGSRLVMQERGLLPRSTRVEVR